MNKCENCGNSHEGNYASGRFCSSTCSRGFSTKSKRSIINKKVSNTLRGQLSKKKGIDKNGNLLETRICPNCNNIVIRKKFCNWECYTSFHETAREAFDNYRMKCWFKFELKDYSDKFDLSLIKTYGLYSPSNKGNNLNGISRDHMYSIKEGFINNIDPFIISHPANCRLINHTDNQSKGTKSTITLEELLQRIKEF